MLSGKCRACGFFYNLKFLGDRAGNPRAPSADRIDPRKGYTRCNVQIICWACNNEKASMTQKDFVLGSLIRVSQRLRRERRRGALTAEESECLAAVDKALDDIDAELMEPYFVQQDSDIKTIQGLLDKLANLQPEDGNDSC